MIVIVGIAMVLRSIIIWRLVFIDFLLVLKSFVVTYTYNWFPFEKYLLLPSYSPNSVGTGNQLDFVDLRNKLLIKHLPELIILPF